MDVEKLIPSTVGKKVRFTTENGRRWVVLKKSEYEYLVSPEGVISPGRSRWGDENQVREDLRYLAENGHLPNSPVSNVRR